MVLNIKSVKGTSDVLAIVTEEPLEGWLHYGGENVKKVRCPKEKQIRADIVFNSWISALSLEPIPPQMWWEKYETHPVKDEDIPF